MKARAKEALPINLYSEKYIIILQMLETQLKRNRKGNSLFYHSPLCLFSIVGRITSSERKVVLEFSGLR